MTEVRPLNTNPLPVKLRVEDYLLLDDSGAFEDYAKTELLDGEIFFMNAQHRPHARLKTRLLILITEALKSVAEPLEAIVEGSISIPPHSVPEPDIVVTSEPEGDGLIPLASVRLIVEVSDSSLDTDLGRKAAIYAAAGIPEYWIADVTARVIHQLWSSEGDSYASRCVIPFGDPLTASTIPKLSLERGEIG